MLGAESEKNTLRPVGACRIFHMRLKKQEDENWYRCDVVVTTTKETFQNQIHCSDRPNVSRAQNDRDKIRSSNLSLSRGI